MSDKSDEKEGRSPSILKHPLQMRMNKALCCWVNPTVRKREHQESMATAACWNPAVYASPRGQECRLVGSTTARVVQDIHQRVRTKGVEVNVSAVE
jgi:hypothetical protein